MAKANLPRAWTVGIEATITQDVTAFYSPAHMKGRGDAIDLAIEQFKSEHTQVKYHIKKVTIVKHQPEPNRINDG